MRTLALLLLLELLFGCFRAPGSVTPLVRAADANTRPVVRVDRFGGRDQWQQTRWFRPGQDAIEWPHRVVVADNGSACLMDERDVREPLPGTFWSCPTAWRIARP